MPATDSIEFLIASALLNLLPGVLAPLLDRFREKGASIMALAAGILPALPLLLLTVGSGSATKLVPGFLHPPLEALFMCCLVFGAPLFMFAAGRYGKSEENHRAAMWTTLAGMLTGAAYSYFICRALSRI